MRVVKMLVVSGVAALIGCFALVGSASAALGPLWGYCHKLSGGTLDAHCGTTANEGYKELLLQSGESLLVLALQLGAQTLTAETPAETISCKVVHAHGYLEGGDPGTDHEKLVYSECSLPNSTGCDPYSQGQTSTSGIIETNALTSELVYLTEKAAEKLEAAITGTLFKPASGKKFVELLLNALTGHTCPASGILPVQGEVVGENLFATSRLLLGTLTFPTTAKLSYWLDTGGTPKKDTITALNLNGTAAVYSGEVSIKVSLLGQFGQWLAFWVCP